MITLREIISNISKGQSAANVRFILQGLQQHYEIIKNKVEIKGYQQDSNSTTIFFSIPSHDKKIFYDVVIWLKTKDKLLLDTQIKVFSNSPVFAYNFCYAFYQSGSLLYPEKYPNDFKILPPMVRNPWQLHSFDKHIYSAIQYTRDIGLKSILENIPSRVPQIKTFVQKKDELQEYQEMKKRR